MSMKLQSLARTILASLAVAVVLGNGHQLMAALDLQLNDQVQGYLTQNGSILGVSGVNFRLYNNGSPTSTTWGSDQGGLLYWTNAAVNGSPVDNFYTSCIEVVQDVYWGHLQSWTVAGLVGAPNPGAQIDATIAGEITALFSNFYPDPQMILSDPNLTTQDRREWAGAYQIALWKLVYDGASSSFSTGNLRVTNTPTGAAANMLAEAQFFLSNLGSASPNATVWALTNPLNQDQAYGVIVADAQVGAAVPEPASLVVWSLLAGGAAGLTVGRRRREVAQGRWSSDTRQAILDAVSGPRA